MMGSTSDSFQPRPVWELLWIAVVCAVAGARVWLCSAALPFFNNVDEPYHYDLVHKYARGYWPVPQQRGHARPGEGDTIDRDAARSITLYSSPEYLSQPGRFPDGKFPPPQWTWPESERDRYVAGGVAFWTRRTNMEAFAPPSYYLLAGIWYDVGKALGFHDGRLLYWIRFLNVPLIMAVVGLAYVFCYRFYPGQRLLCLGVPLLVALVPQDIFYAIHADVLSPLLFLAGLILLLEWHRRPQVSNRFCLATGLVLAATFLVTYTNVALVVVFGFLALYRFVQHRRDRSTLLIGVTAAVPVACWFLRNKLVLGDFMGTAAKVQHLGWTPKPLSAMFHHPLFTLSGLGHYLYELTAQLWRGEITWWNMPRLAEPVIDPFLVGLSAVLLGAALVRWLLGKRAPQGQQPVPPVDPSRFTDGICFLALAVSVLTLMGLSLVFDFGRCPYPSNEEPYFYSARLIVGILVPFFVLYVRGLQFLFARAGRVVGPVLGIGATGVLMVLSKLGPILVAGHSAYNWFHLP